MEATRATEQSQDSRRNDTKRNVTKLDERYGKIGISAVAGAVRHKGEPRKVNEKSRFVPQDSD